MVSTPLYLTLVVSCIILFNNVYSYHLSLTPMTWSSASDYCINHCSSQLASIRTIDQYKITQEIISNSDINYVANNNNPIWIGFNNIQNPDAWAWRNWTWQDGSDTTKFQLWGFLQPDSTSSTTANCVAIDPNTNKWLNAECDEEEYAFFCNSCDGEITKLVSPTDTFSTFTEAQDECTSLYETSISMDTISSFDEAEFFAIATSAASTQFLIESSENQDCRVYDEIEGTLLCDSDLTNPGVLCEMPSELCDSRGGLWHNVQGVEMEEYYGVSCGKKINSLYDDSINIIMNKQWKTCNVLKPFVIEMTYATSNPSTASRTGIVIYPPNEVDKDDENGGFNDHYFIRLHPVDGEIHIGFEKEGIEYLLQDNKGVDYSWGDDQWETLRVEVHFGYMFTIYLNDALVLQTRPYNPFNINMMDVMSGYVGIESIKGDILIKSLYMSGMEVLEDDDTQDYMYNCRFIYDENVDATTTTPAPTTSPTTSTTDVPTTTIPATITTTKETATKGTTTKSTTTKATTTTTKSTTTTTEYDDSIMYGGAHANVDTNSGLAGGDTVSTGGNAKQFIVYAIIAAIVCCIIIVGIYYIKLNKKRQREQQLQSVFGRQSRRISRSNDEIAEIVAEAHVMQEGRRSSGNSTSSFDTMPTSPPRHLTTQSNQSGMIHMHVVDGFDRPSTVWNNNALHHNNNQRGQGQLQVQQQAQRPYGGKGHEYDGDDDDDADILNSWDVEALEMDCNNIIKNNKLKSRNRAYSE